MVKMYQCTHIKQRNKCAFLRFLYSAKHYNQSVDHGCNAEGSADYYSSPRPLLRYRPSVLELEEVNSELTSSVMSLYWCSIEIFESLSRGERWDL